MCGNEDCFKIAKFCAKTKSNGRRSGEVEDVQRRSRFAQNGHESWVYCYDIETKSQLSEWKPPKKAFQVRSNVKAFLSIFFDYNDVVHHVFLSQGCTANKEFYLEVMPRLRSKIP